MLVSRRPRPCPETKFLAGAGKSNERNAAGKLLCVEMKLNPDFGDCDGQTAFPEGAVRACLVGAVENPGPAIRNFRCRSKEGMRPGGSSHTRSGTLGEKDGRKNHVASGATRASPRHGRPSPDGAGARLLAFRLERRGTARPSSAASRI